MNVRSFQPLLLVLLAACAMPREVVDTRERTRETIQRAVRLYGQLCAPEELANAQSHLDFANVELYQGGVRRADQHIKEAYEHALKNSVEEALSTLKEREAKILRLYFGLDDQEPMTLEEIGTLLGITRERVRQIKEKALLRLRHASRARFLETFFN